MTREADESWYAFGARLAQAGQDLHEFQDLDWKDWEELTEGHYEDQGS